jgi:hypothetical protein
LWRHALRGFEVHEMARWGPGVPDVVNADVVNARYASPTPANAIATLARDHTMPSIILSFLAAPGPLSPIKPILTDVACRPDLMAVVTVLKQHCVLSNV